MFAAFFHRAVLQAISLLFGCTGEILTEKSGNLNLGIPGIMYVGGISGVVGGFIYENSLESKDDANWFLAIFIPLICCLVGSLIMGLIYCFLESFYCYWIFCSNIYISFVCTYCISCNFHCL